MIKQLAAAYIATGPVKVKITTTYPVYSQKDGTIHRRLSFARHYDARLIDPLKGKFEEAGR